MWKVLAWVFLLEISTIYSARNNGYFRAFRRGFYPGKTEEHHHSTESRNYYRYRINRHHGFGFPSFPAVYFLRPNHMGHDGYPVYPFHEFVEPDDSIYDYKLKVQSHVEPMTTEELEVDKSEKTTNQEKDSMEMMKVNKKEQKEVMEQETVHTPRLITAVMPRMVQKKPHKTTVIRTRVSLNSQDKQKINTAKSNDKSRLVFNGKFSGTCGNDGLYYKDGTNYIICTNSQAIVQPCAPGTQNQDMMTFTRGSEYNQFDFCTINVVARGSYNSNIITEDESGSKTDKLMNMKVKNYFEQHYINHF